MTTRSGRGNNASAVGGGEETIGQRVRRLRLERGFSQRQISGPGASYAYVSRIEAGHRQPSLGAIRLLAQRLDVTPEYLETGEEVPAAKARALRVSDAELALRLERGVAAAEQTLAVVIAERSDDASGARAQAALGLLAARRGQNGEAIRRLEAAIGTGLIRPELRSDVFEALAGCLAASGQGERAIRLLEDCLEAVGMRSGEEALTAKLRYRVFIGEHLATVGQLARARAVLTEAIEAASEHGSPSARVALYWALGKVAWDEGDSEAAEAYMERAVAILETTEDTLQLARANLATAQMLTMEGRAEEAGPYLNRAERLLELAGDSDDRGALRAEQAKRAAKLGDAEEGVARAKEAIELVAGDVRYAATAHHALAIAHAAAGNIDEADAAFKAASDGLVERGHWREATQVARDWAAMLRAAGRERDAMDVLDQGVMLAVRHIGASTRARS